MTWTLFDWTVAGLLLVVAPIVAAVWQRHVWREELKRREAERRRILWWLYARTVGRSLLPFVFLPAFSAAVKAAKEFEDAMLRLRVQMRIGAQVVGDFARVVSEALEESARSTATPTEAVQDARRRLLGPGSLT